MISTTHTLLALALFTKKGTPTRNWSVFAGSVIPDSFIYVAWIILTYVLGVPQETIWKEVYFDDPMQTIASIFNSVPIYAALLAVGVYFRKTIWGMALMFFGLAALSHIALDFPVHNHDAYAHFWPFSEWRFVSPFSYYETHLHGNVVGMLDASIAIVSALVLWRRFPRTWVRVILGLLMTAMSVIIIGRLGLLPQV